MKLVPIDSYRMLNLEIGKVYMTKSLLNKEITHVFRVRNKTIHSPEMHSYMGTWPNPGSECEWGRYFWDYGTANRGVAITHDAHSIIDCWEMTENEAQEYWEKTQPYNKGLSDGEGLVSEGVQSKQDVVHTAYS